MYQLLKEQMEQFYPDKKTWVAIVFMSSMVFLFGNMISIAGVCFFFMFLSQQIRSQKSALCPTEQPGNADILAMYLATWLVMIGVLLWLFLMMILGSRFSPLAMPISNLKVVFLMLLLVNAAFIALYIPLNNMVKVELRQSFATMLMIIAVSFMLFIHNSLPLHISDLSVLVFTFPLTITALSIIATKKWLTITDIVQESDCLHS